ncbi:hypothetical protein DBL05_10120 [Pseudomonas putida]|nr:hypothetical protein DBL05_10120 [Pseudomonas putida]
MEQLSCSISISWRDPCGSGLVSRKGREAAPALFASTLKSRGCCAALSRHKAAPTGTAPGFRCGRRLSGLPAPVRP